MTTYAWPTTEDMAPRIVSFGAIDRTPMSESPYTGAIATGEVPFSYRRKATIGWPGTNDFAVQNKRLAWLMRIRRAHRVTFPNWTQPAPAGTMRGSPVLSSSALQGATAVAITTSGSGETIKAGDWLGVTTAAGVQVVTAVADATGVSTAITLTFEPPLRAAASSSAAVVWNAPSVTWMLADSDWIGEFRPKEGVPLVVDFLEVW